MTKEQFNSYEECAKSQKWRREVQKNVMEEKKEEGGTSGVLDSSYKSRAPLPFFDLL